MTLQEEELRKSSDPKYQHLNDDLHVEITAFAPPSEAHARIAYALTEVSELWSFHSLQGDNLKIGHTETHILKGVEK